MFEGYRVYKVWHKKQKRWYAILYVKGHTTTMSWARYTMTLHLGKMIDSTLEVDHINGDRSDDRVENLQLLDHAANARKSARPKTLVTLVCPYCKKDFTRPRNNTHLVKGGNPTHCSRRCATKHQFSRH